VPANEYGNRIVTSPAASPPRKIRSGYIPTLDGWRALAIIAVLINHDMSWLPTSQIHKFGRPGVDLFFALSGILICTRLLEEEQISKKISLRNFYIRRIFRIQPAALVYLACVSLLTFSGVLDHTLDAVGFSLLMIRNYFQPHYAGEWYTAHFWSLSVEEHFYLFLPGFLVIFKKFRVSLLVVLVCILKSWQMYVHRYVSIDSPLASPFRTEAAAIGILIAAIAAILLFRSPVRAWCQSWLHPYVALGLAVAVWFGSYKLPAFSWFFYFATLSSYPLVVISTLLNPSTLIGKVLEWSPLRFVGRISYSLYLWQMMFFGAGYGIPAPNSHLLFHLQTSLLRYPATLAVSIFSYYIIEKPMVKLGHRLAKSVVPGREASTILPTPASEVFAEPITTASNL
jgi:peptidoglycan/LPS O-acetylase OafA/YrhL